MKNAFYLMILVLFISSCQQGTRNKTEIGQFSNNAKSIKNDADQKLKDQLKAYNDALHGDQSNPERVLDFIYDDVFIYLKKQNPDTYSKEMVISLFNEPVKRLKEMSRENNVIYNTSIGDIVQRVSEGNKLIYKIEIFLNMEYGLEKHSTGDRILGISLDSGQNWKFLEITPNTTPDILGMRFSPETINEVMN